MQYQAVVEEAVLPVEVVEQLPQEAIDDNRSE